MLNKTQLPLMVTRSGAVWNPYEQVGDASDEQFLNSLDAEYHNSLGAEQTISTLTAILPDIIKQKNYKVANLSSFVNIAVGKGNPFAAEMMNFAQRNLASDFESGLSNMRSNAPDGQSDNLALEPIKRQVITWTKYMNYNMLENRTMATATGGMVDYLKAQTELRKDLYDLGIQDTVFWGLKSNPTDFQGLLTQSDVTINTTLITKKIADMTTAEINAFVGAVYEAYRANCNRTAQPEIFLIPEDDFNGLAKQYSETIGGLTRIQLLEDAFKLLTGNSNFQVLSTPFAMASYNAAITGLNKNRYVLYNKDPKSLIMDVPIDFTVTLPVPVDGINFKSAAYSRFTGVKQLRAPEMLYFDRTPAST